MFIVSSKIQSSSHHLRLPNFCFKLYEQVTIINAVNLPFQIYDLMVELKIVISIKYTLYNSLPLLINLVCADPVLVTMPNHK